jgi:hypothetical protein
MVLINLLKEPLFEAAKIAFFLLQANFFNFYLNKNFF